MVRTVMHSGVWKSGILIKLLLVLKVIGASRGIGQEIAIELGLLGAVVVCVDVKSIGNEGTVKQIRINGGQAYAYTCDVKSSDQVDRTIQSIERDVSAITMLFHCCGVPSPRTYTDAHPPAVQETINTSIMSHFWVNANTLFIHQQ